MFCKEYYEVFDKCYHKIDLKVNTIVFWLSSQYILTVILLLSIFAKKDGFEFTNTTKKMIFILNYNTWSTKKYHFIIINIL